MNDQPPTSSPPPAPPATPKTAGLATASLVLGILGMICILPVVGSLLAVIFAIVALIKISNSKGALRGQGQAIAGLILGGVSLLMIPILAGMLLPALASAREKARRVQCQINMRMIATACLQYASDHDSTLPGTWDDVKSLLPNTSMLVCPSATGRSDASYELVAAGKLTDLKSNDVLIREDPGNHRSGGNVAYANGEVRWQTGD